MNCLQLVSYLNSRTLWCVFLFISSLGTSQVFSAELTPIDDQITKCKYQITGVIERNDAERIKGFFATKIGYSNPNEWTLDFTPSFNDAVPFVGAANRFSNQNTQRICLNSPGGSFLEALKIANIIHEMNFGTIVPRDAVCESACAIIFLAGSFMTEGESIVADRHIHATARLGFHAPSLVLPKNGDQLFDREVVMKAYKVAIESMAIIQKGVALLNLRSSLLAQMLSTAPDDMFYIDTVGKARRWHIGVYGTKIPISIGGHQMQFACDAAIESLFDDQSLYSASKNNASIRSEYEQQSQISFSRSGPSNKLVYKGARTGYLAEAVSNCNFIYTAEQDAESLNPGYMPGSVTFADENLQVDIGPHFLFASGTKLQTLARRDDGRIETISFKDNSKSASGTTAIRGMCRVISGRQIVDAEECIQTKENNAIVHKWPSGSKTVIARKNGQLTVNGSSARFLQDGKSGNNQHLGRCHLNRRTQNIFCFYDYTSN